MQITHKDSGGIFIFCYNVSTILQSPGLATFGGFWPVKSFYYSPKIYRELFIEVMKEFSGIKLVKIVLPPATFFPGIFAEQLSALKSLESYLTCVDYNFSITVNDWSRAQLSHGNRKKVRRFFELGGTISLGNSEDINQSYSTLVENRELRGVKLSMSQKLFKRGLLELSESYQLIVAKLEGTVIATAYVVKITPSYAYVLFWGEKPKFRTLSPVASILNFLIDWSKKNKIETLDLGVSSNQGLLDLNLARFKYNLGAKVSEKNTIYLRMSHE